MRIDFLHDVRIGDVRRMDKKIVLRMSLDVVNSILCSFKLIAEILYYFQGWQSRIHSTCLSENLVHLPVGKLRSKMDLRISWKLDRCPMMLIWPILDSRYFTLFKTYGAKLVYVRSSPRGTFTDFSPRLRGQIGTAFGDELELFLLILRRETV